MTFCDQDLYTGHPQEAGQLLDTSQDTVTSDTGDKTAASPVSQVKIIMSRVIDFLL